MKSMKQFSTVLLVCLSLTHQSWSNDELETDSFYKETTVTACWIECSLDRVLKDLEQVPGLHLNLDPNISSRLTETYISLEVIDIDYEQVLAEILSPIGLKYNPASMFISESRIHKPDEQSSLAFCHLWATHHKLSLPDWEFDKSSNERTGWTYTPGKIFPSGVPSEFNKPKKVIHRWISSRHKITISTATIRSMNYNKTEAEIETTTVYIFLPVVERITEHAAAKDGLIGRL